MGFLLSIFIMFAPAPTATVHLTVQHEDYEQRCQIGCFISYTQAPWLRECITECEGYDGEAG